jgi:hypothetical protein
MNTVGHFGGSLQVLPGLLTLSLARDEPLLGFSFRQEPSP